MNERSVDKDSMFLKMYTHYETDKVSRGINKEYRTIKEKASELLKSFQSEKPRFINQKNE